MASNRWIILPVCLSKTKHASSVSRWSLYKIRASICICLPLSTPRPKQGDSTTDQTRISADMFICYVGTFKLHGTDNFISKKHSQLTKKYLQMGPRATILLLLTAIFSDSRSNSVQTRKLCRKPFSLVFIRLNVDKFHAFLCYPRNKNNKNSEQCSNEKSFVALMRACEYYISHQNLKKMTNIECHLCIPAKSSFPLKNTI